MYSYNLIKPIIIMLRIIILIFFTTLAFSSCKKKGCTDINAINYDSSAKINNGLCTYEEIIDTTLPEISISDDHQLQEISTTITCLANDSIYWMNFQSGMLGTSKQISGQWTSCLPQGISASGFQLNVNAIDASNNANSEVFLFNVTE
jgi:hypothetical protein